MNDICKLCGNERPPTPSGSKLSPCPDCGATAQVIQATIHAMAGPATCEMKGIVIRLDPAVLELRAPNVEIIVNVPPGEADLEPPSTNAPGRLSLKERRVAAYYVCLDDVRREPEDSIIIDYLVERLFASREAMIRDIEGGRY